MQKVAKVIVDVPTMQTDQPFTYLVPENLNEPLNQWLQWFLTKQMFS